MITKRQLREIGIGTIALFVFVIGVIFAAYVFGG
jgi:hypothetical protein